MMIGHCEIEPSLGAAPNIQLCTNTHSQALPIFVQHQQPCLHVTPGPAAGLKSSQEETKRGEGSLHPLCAALPSVKRMSPTQS